MVEATPSQESVEEQPKTFKDLEDALKVGKADPIGCAKQVRAVFRRHGWPNREMPKSVRQVLMDHGVAILDVDYMALTEGQARKARHELERVRG